MAEEINDLKIDIAIIKKDIKTIERFFNKVDNVVDDISDISKMIAVQQQLIQNFQEKISFTDLNLEEAKRQSIEGRMALRESLDEFKNDFAEDMQTRVSNAHKDHENLAMELKLWNEKRHTQIQESIDKVIQTHELRIRKLEQLKWYITGFAAMGMFLIGMGSDIVEAIRLA